MGQQSVSVGTIFVQIVQQAMDEDEEEEKKTMMMMRRMLGDEALGLFNACLYCCCCFCLLVGLASNFVATNACYTNANIGILYLVLLLVLLRVVAFGWSKRCAPSVGRSVAGIAAGEGGGGGDSEEDGPAGNGAGEDESKQSTQSMGREEGTAQQQQAQIGGGGGERPGAPIAFCRRRPSAVLLAQ
ncbi:hypothetical protein niasHT_032239 [Heterodera trifolii]|uniref:Uncharacterized protein n=1 Tax=Heterodera trifolii TaxID=157864 RepID=A0ABD2HSH2_9BILA